MLKHSFTRQEVNDMLDRAFEWQRPAFQSADNRCAFCRTDIAEPCEPGCPTHRMPQVTMRNNVVSENALATMAYWWHESHRNERIIPTPPQPAYDWPETDTLDG